uniref:Uncharacterized protein n=1 Tax=Noccaea caerulescens TaxID=107243 RepID=A0A1J3K531_NOCCA
MYNKSFYLEKISHRKSFDCLVISSCLATLGYVLESVFSSNNGRFTGRFYVFRSSHMHRWRQNLFLNGHCFTSTQ